MHCLLEQTRVTSNHLPLLLDEKVPTLCMAHAKEQQNKADTALVEGQADTTARNMTFVDDPASLLFLGWRLLCASAVL